MVFDEQAQYKKLKEIITEEELHKIIRATKIKKYKLAFVMRV